MSKFETQIVIVPGPNNEIITVSPLKTTYFEVKSSEPSGTAFSGSISFTQPEASQKEKSAAPKSTANLDKPSALVRGGVKKEEKKVLTPEEQEAKLKAAKELYQMLGL